MSEGFNRRKFIKTGGSILLLLPLVEYCKSKPKGTTSNTGKPVNKGIGRHTSKKRKQPIVASMVTNRGWYKNKKNNKIHFFDNRGFTPSLQYLKNKNEFDAFIKHLEPWDAKQMTLEIYQKNISKKSKDWMTETAALAFISSGNYANAAMVIKERITKRPVNLRLWDLLALVTLRSGDEQLKAAQQELVAKYNDTKDKKLYVHLAGFNRPEWQVKMKDKEITWNNQKI